MTLEQAKKIVAILGEDGIEARVYENYSGRGMCGMTCTGIVCDDPVAVGYAAGKAKVPMGDIPKRRDSMGMSKIIY